VGLRLQRRKRQRRCVLSDLISLDLAGNPHRAVVYAIRSQYEAPPGRESDYDRM
jgi:hypothetical protein